MKSIETATELDDFPTRTLEMPGGAVTEIIVPESRKEEVLRQLYPFVGVPRLDDEMYDLHEDRPFRVRDYKVVLTGGVHFLVSPYFAHSGGSVIDWIPMRGRRRAAGSVDVRRCGGTGALAKASAAKAHASRRASVDVGVCLMSLALLSSVVLAFRPAPAALGEVFDPEPECIASVLMAKLDLDELRQLSEMGDPEATFELAHRMEEGIGVPRDASAASHMYLKAEEQGYDLPAAIVERLNL